jgi:hypothetical protein
MYSLRNKDTNTSDYGHIESPSGMIGVYWFGKDPEGICLHLISYKETKFRWVKD